MKILKLILRNFSAVENALKTTEVTIDFTRAKNTICLLIGPNGSGKTTILSMLHPFADIGNLDVRHGMKLILENEEGYKEIVIKKKKHIYVIKHFYFPHKDKSHSIKSYIELDGEELNPNGNVTSFKEIIKEELQIEPDYLKLIRLGSNVTSLIDLSPTERKNFMGKIMDDIGIYLQYYKSVNTKLRHLEEIISHTVDKIKRLGIIDKDKFESDISNMRTSLSQLETEYIETSNQLAVLENRLSEIEDVDMLASNLKAVTKTYDKMIRIIEKKNQLESKDISFYENEINTLSLRLNGNINELAANQILIENLLKQKNSYYEQIHSLEIQLRKEEESDMELVRMDKNLDEMRVKLRQYEDNIGEYRATYSLRQLEEFIVFLKNIQQILSRTYEFGKPPVEKVVNLMSKQKNVIHYINTHLMDIDDKKNDQASVFMQTLFARTMLTGQPVEIVCKDECAAKNLYNQFMNLAKNSQITDKTETSSFYHDMEHVYSNIKSVIDQFSDFKHIIHELPDDVKQDFLMSNIFKKIIALKPIYNETKMYELLSLATEYENYLALSKQYEIDLATYRKFNNLTNIGSIREQLERLYQTLNDIEGSISDYKERTIELELENKELERSIESYSDIKETLEKFDEIKSSYEKLSSDFETFKKLSESIYEIRIKLTTQKLTIDKMNEEYQQKLTNLSEYKKLNKELSKMNEKYDNFVYIKRALSSKEGIPVYRMRMCLGNTEAITNELLDIIYDGKLSIAEFNITPTEFSIPFYNNHVLLSDVKYASQGELSFLSIALSFALSSQVLSKYNIMLLDEIDGPLDTPNREKFIKILENQIDRIQSEQSFLITHNSMFSSYPVDILDFSFENNEENFPLANFIEIRRK